MYTRAQEVQSRSDGICWLMSQQSMERNFFGLFFTPAMIIETVMFAIDRVLARPFVHGMSDETCI